MIGSRGTAVMSDRAVAIVDAPPASPAATAWEALVFDPAARAEPLDPFAVLEDDDLTAFVLVEATPSGTLVVRHGDAAVMIHERPWTTDEPTATTLIGLDDPVTIALGAADEAPTGQWVTRGVVAGSSVVVGRLQAPAAARPTTANPVVQVLADIEADFGNLLFRASSGASAPEPEPERTPEPEPAPAATTAAEDDPKPGTAAFFHTDAIARDAVLRTSDGRTYPVTTPIVFGRRPPDGPIGGQTPQIVVVDDTLISRHHATALVVDGRLVVVDEGSTNGMWVTAPGGEPVRCVPNQPTEVPPGAMINIAGVLQAVHEAGAD